ncbi:MAG TPA: hypothetical protein VME67_25990 [Mycobacterium sp.]|nr:hypothetical protein [Mycobacterium sp.]HTX97977.1 hypothetical protein [Mycobacterium sp.]
MKRNRKKPIGAVLGVVPAAIVSGFLPVSTAHADANCTVPGSQLNIHHSSGYDVTVDASGASLGPAATIHVTPELSSDANVTAGGIKGRNIDFNIGWYGTKAMIHFTGTVGDDGIAHGTSGEIIDPVTRHVLNQGPWDSTTRLTC